MIPQPYDPSTHPSKSDCSREAVMYGECVSIREMPAKDDCLKEFDALKRCIQKAAAERKIKPR